MQQSVRNVCAKCRVDRLSRFRIVGRHVLTTTQKRFPSEIPLTMKTATLNSHYTLQKPIEKHQILT